MKKTLITLLMLSSFYCANSGDDQTDETTTSTKPACSTLDRTSGTGSVSTSPVTNNNLTQSQLTEILQQVNAVRTAGNCTCPAYGSTAQSEHAAQAAVTWNAKLETAAAGHSNDMMTNNFFSHTGSSGSTAGSRITAASYSWKSYNENIAAGQADVTAVMKSWLESGGHCRNIMSSTIDELGVAMRNNTGSATYSKYWTMNMGRD